MVFKTKHITETYSDPVSSICEIGRFDGPDTTYADLVFMREGIDGVKTYMNSTVLRELLLSNPDLIANTTQVACIDLSEYKKLVEGYNALLKENEELKAKSSKNKKKARLDVEEVK